MLNSRSNPRLLAMLLALSASGCSLLPEAHRIDISQGNIISQEAIDQLKPGMSEAQVKFLMGSPALQDIFHPERWDYIYYESQQGEAVVNKKLSLMFSDGLLSKASSEDYEVAHLQVAAPPVSVAESPAPAPAVEVFAEPEAVQVVVTPEPEPELDTVPELTPQQAVEQHIQAWARAWSEQEAAAYIDSYQADYHPHHLSHAAWKKQRHQRLALPEFIHITLSDITVGLNGDNRATATFQQDYQSNTYQDSVLKELQLERTDTQWKITAEKSLSPR